MKTVPSRSYPGQKSYQFTLYILCITLLLFPGCEVLQPGTTKSSSASSTLKPPKPPSGGGYLSRKPPPQLQSGTDASGMEMMDSKMSKGDLMLKVRQAEKELITEKKERKRLQIELSELKTTYQSEVESLTTALTDEKKTGEINQEKAVAAEFKALKVEQQLDRIKMDLIMKRDLFQSNYPAFYEVVRGDSLWNIASRGNIYNNAYKWTEIYYANRDKLDDKDVIFPGQVLRIPRYFEMVLDSFESDLERYRQQGELSEGESDDLVTQNSAGADDEAWEDIL